jgi:flavin reductase (DIM6/NTAB) family NADH-FMN oxidoreductase RutF
MQPLQKLLNKLNGLHYQQEYLCLAKESFQNPIHAYFFRGGQVIKDITKEHLFTGYSPLIFTLTSSDLKEPFSNIEIAFSQRSLQPNDLFKKRDALAWLSLRLIQKQIIGTNEIYYYEGIRGKHQFISSFHQLVIGLSNQMYNKKKENVFLKNNLYKQVQIAYSVPRTISLITVGSGGLYNLFPTDLHGQVNEQYYVSALRHGGKACMQVENAGRIVISQVHSEIYKTVYSLGKNHMQELRPKESSFFSESLSNIFNLPLPKSVLSYKELELTGSFDHGIHKLLLYKIISSQVVNEELSTLAHIHNSYATWRYNKGLPGSYLFR